MNRLSNLLTGSNSPTKAAEQAVMDRNWYIRGKEGYPTAPPETLSEGVTERERGCYQMGYNYELYQEES